MSSSHRQYEDIYALQAYFSNANATQLKGASQITFYLSPTPAHRSGTVCASNFTATRFTPDFHQINCSATISNALYVTLERPTANAPDAFIYIVELLILRSGKPPRKQMLACSMLMGSVKRLTSWRHAPQ